MPKIIDITAREIIASGGYPTVESKVRLDSNISATASVPYGASAGSHEAVMKTDRDPTRYSGKGVLEVVGNIEDKITPKLVDKDPNKQREIDQTMLELDGTENKSKLGGNATLAVSLAVAKAAARDKDIPLFSHLRDVFEIKEDVKLPKPMAVAIEGGEHADQTTDVQEYCLSIIKDEGPKENIRKILECYHELRSILNQEGFSTNVGNEGAFAPSGIESNEKPLEFLVRAIKQAGYTPGEDIGISLDAAASEFYQNGKYELKLEDKTFSSEELLEFYRSWFEKYPIVSVEDLFAEDDWSSWVKLNNKLKKQDILNVGDDLTVTNKSRLNTAIEKGAITAILIKLNQIGSVSETIETCRLANKHNLVTIPSHRGGGETNDTAMIDLALAVGSEYIKVGPTRGERVCKYNRLLQLEEKIS